jgi:hypothetical protein
VNWRFKLNYASLSGSSASSGVALNHIKPLHYHFILTGERTADFALFSPVFASDYDNRIIFSYFHLTRPLEPKI